MTTLQLPQAPPPVWEGVSARKRALWRVEGILYRHRDAFMVGALIVLAIVLRMAVTRGFWLDEATSVAQAKMGFGRMISYLRQSDVHPPLFQTILWLDIRAFGLSEFAVRLPSLVFGTALVPVMYGAGKDIFNRHAGLVAALIAAISPVVVWYSQEARMYPMFIFFAAVAIWAQVRAVRTGSFKAWGFYTAATIFLLWTQYFSALHVAVQQLAFLGLMWQGRKTIEGRHLFKQWIRSILVIAMFCVPLVYMALGQVANYGIRDTTTVQANGSVESGAPIYTAISNLASSIIGYHSNAIMTQVNALWPLGMLAALFTLGRGTTRVTKLLTALIFLPMAVLFVIGLSRNDVFELRYFAGAIPAIILLVGRAVTLISRKASTVGALALVITLVMGIALWDEQKGGSNARVYDFRTTLVELNQQHQPGDVMLYEPFYLHPTVNYYAPSYASRPLVAGLTSTTAPNRIIIVDSLSFAERDVSAQRVQNVVDRLSLDRTLVSHVERNNIEVWTFQ